MNQLEAACSSRSVPAVIGAWGCIVLQAINKCSLSWLHQQGCTVAMLSLHEGSRLLTRLERTDLLYGNMVRQSSLCQSLQAVCPG